MAVMLPALLRRVASLGHRVFEGEGNPNLIVQRSPEVDAGLEDDLLSLVLFDRGRWVERAWPCSADPGRHFLAHPVHPDGALVLAEGQNRGSHARGLHKGRAALVQVGPIAFRRDYNRNAILDPGGAVLVEAGHGANVHDDAGLGAEASAGCVVAPKAAILELLELLAATEARWGKAITLTVIRA